MSYNVNSDPEPPKKKPKTNPPAQAPKNKRVYYSRADLLRLAAEAKRLEFRKYLNASGIMQVITNALLDFYEENEPYDALEYMYDKLSNQLPIRLQYRNAVGEKEEMEEKVVELEVQNYCLRKHLEMYEPPEFDSDEIDGEGIESEEVSSVPEA